MNRVESSSPACAAEAASARRRPVLRTPSPPSGEGDGVRGRGSWERCLFAHGCGWRLPLRAIRATVKDFSLFKSRASHPFTEFLIAFWLGDEVNHGPA